MHLARLIFTWAVLGPVLSTASVHLGIEIHSLARGGTPDEYFTNSLLIADTFQRYVKGTMNQEFSMFACFNSDVDNTISSVVIPALADAQIPFFFSASADVSICTLEYPGLENGDILFHMSYDFITSQISLTDFDRSFFALPSAAVLEVNAAHQALLRTRSSSIVASRKLVSAMLIEYARDFDLSAYLHSVHSSSGRVPESAEHPHFPLFTPAAIEVKHESVACRLWWPLNGSEVLHLPSASPLSTSTIVVSCDFVDGLDEHINITTTFRNAKEEKTIGVQVSTTAYNLKNKDSPMLYTATIPSTPTDYSLSISLDSDIRGNLGSFPNIHQKIVRFEDMQPLQPVQINPMLMHLFRVRQDVGIVLNALGLVGTLVEVGVHRGDFAQEILTHWRGKHYVAVDPYEEGFVEDYVDGVNVAEKDRLSDMQLFYDNTAKDAHRRTLLRMRSVEGAKRFVDNTLDAVYIDAIHHYHMVMQDMQAWWSKVKSGGILMGHDYFLATDQFLYTVKPAVLEFARKMNVLIFDTVDFSWYIVKP
jgi:hypothetical protein